jgi:hypothetical protein
MPCDTEAYDTYTEILDSLGSSNIYSLIGINSFFYWRPQAEVIDRGTRKTKGVAGLNHPLPPVT